MHIIPVWKALVPYIGRKALDATTKVSEQRIVVGVQYRETSFRSFGDPWKYIPFPKVSKAQPGA
jgi:hypothetical protein